MRKWKNAKIVKVLFLVSVFCLQLCSETDIYWLFNDMFNMCYIDVKDCINCRGIALGRHCTVCNLLHNIIVRLICKNSHFNVNTIVLLAFVSNQMPLVFFKLFSLAKYCSLFKRQKFYFVLVFIYLMTTSEEDFNATFVAISKC